MMSLCPPCRFSSCCVLVTRLCFPRFGCDLPKAFLRIGSIFWRVSKICKHCGINLPQLLLCHVGEVARGGHHDLQRDVVDAEGALARPDAKHSAFVNVNVM